MRYRNENWPVDGEYTPTFSGFKLTANTNSTVGFTSSAAGLAYSTDFGTTWTNYSTAGQTISLNAGQTICFRRRYTSALATALGTFELTGNLTASGNVMSLLSTNYDNMTDLTGWGGNTTNSGIFKRLFYNCTSLTNINNLTLPATTLSNYCYIGMFQGCTSLTNAALLILPATNLAGYCYTDMFQGCTSLTTAPALPATNLGVCCYLQMFQDCTSLTTAPDLSATTLVNGCYMQIFKNCSSLNYIKCLATDISASACTDTWVDGVSSTGTFVKDANMTSWTTGTSGIPSGWTVQDT